MFGYVRPYRPSVTLGDYEFYRSVYCGICRAMKRQTGQISSMTLNYDMVFLALARIIVGGRTISIHPHRCAVHPLKPRAMVVDNPATDYAARATVLLAYRKLADDVTDGRFLGKVPPATAKALLSRAKKRAGLAPLDREIETCLTSLSEMERGRVASIDRPAGAFGKLLGDIFAFRAPEAHADALRKVGDAVGRFIYCADAAEDFPRDVRSGSYNPYVLTYGDTLSDDAKLDIRASLINTLAAGEAAWRTLPLSDAGAAGRLFLNILYEGLPHRVDFLLPDAPKGKHKLTPYDGVLP